jgi:hypothetical protein
MGWYFPGNPAFSGIQSAAAASFRKTRRIVENNW